MTFFLPSPDYTLLSLSAFRVALRNELHFCYPSVFSDTLVFMP